MNSSKMSLKEGFDFLFENEEDQAKDKSSEKWTVTFEPEKTSIEDAAGKVAFILAADILAAVVSGEDETPIQKIYNNPEQGKELRYVAGKTISFKVLSKLATNPQTAAKVLNLTKDNVKGPILKIAAKYRTAIATLANPDEHNILGMLLVENKEKKRIKISVKTYSRFVFRMKSSNIIPKDKRHKKTINLNKIWEFCLEAINSGELVKDGLDIEFKEASKQTQLLYKIKSFLSKLTPYQRESFGVDALKIFMQDLSNEEPIEKSYLSFQNNMSKKASRLNRKIMDAFVRSIIDAPSEKEAVDKIDQFIDIVPEENQSEESTDMTEEQIDQLMDTLPGDDLPSIDFESESDALPQSKSDESNSDDVDSMLREAKGILKDLQKELQSLLDKEKSLANSNQFVESTLKSIETFLPDIAAFKAGIELYVNSLKSNNNINIKQEREFNNILTETQKIIKDLGEIFDRLSASKSDGAKKVVDGLTNISWDPNTAERIPFEDIFPDINADEVITKVKSEFEEIKTQIGEPTSQSDESSRDDEVKTTSDDQYKVTTTLEQPKDGDYNDFLRKYLAIASFLAITTNASSEILSDSSRRLKAGELVNILKKWSKQAKVDNDVLSNSISNLAKFTHKNVEGIIFERADSNKHFIKMKARDFASSSLLLQKQMKEDMPQDCFQFIQAFPAPIFELTDSKGEVFYPDVKSAIDHFMRTNNQARSLKRKEDSIEFLVEEKRYFQLATDRNNLFVFTLIDPKNTDISSSENDQYAIDAATICENTADSICDILKIRNSKHVKIVKDFMDDFAKTKVENFRKGLTEVDIDLSEDDTKSLTDAITGISNGVDDQQKTQTLVSKGNDKPEIKNNISSVEELSNDKVVRKMMSAIYRDGSLNNFLATMTPVEFAAVKAGKDKRLINDFKARAILAINPELGAIKLNVKDIYNGEMKEVFNALFLSKSFDESAMRAAYTKTIVSAFDKLIGKEHSRITEGLFSGIKRMAAAGAANLLKMAPVLALVKAITFIPFVGAAIPFIMAGFVSWITFSSWRDIAKWEKAKKDYQADPYGYIEKTLFEDKSSRKVIKSIVNAAAADVIVARLNPVYAKQSQQTVTAGISGGASEFQKNFDEQMSEFNSLSEEDRRAAKVLNDRVIGQLAKTKYYNSVITEAMINMIFNEVMFGKDRVSNETRKMLLAGNFDMQSEARKDLQDSLVNAIKKSAIKNNLIDFVHKEVKKLKNKRFTKADDAELERRKRYGSEKDIDTSGMGKFAAAKAKVGAAMSDNVVGGMYAQYFISPEQIHEEAIDELVQKVVGLSKEEYQKRFEFHDNDSLFSENILRGSLAKLLFEAVDDSESKDNSDEQSEEISPKQQALQNKREEANKQKDNTSTVIAALGAGSYVNSLWLSMFMRKYADKQIVKYILQTIPGKAATASKVIWKFAANPAAAKADNLLGQDMGHGLFEFTDNGVKKQLYAYYYSEAKYAGSAKALSGQLIDPVTGKAQMLQHNLYEYFTENKSWFTNHGMEVTKNGIVKVINPKLCTSLGANSPEMAKATNIIMTNLEGQYPVETKAMVAKITTFDIGGKLQPLLDAGGGNMSEFAQYLYKSMANQSGLEGHHVVPHDQMYEGFLNHWKHLLDKASTSGSTAKEKAANWDACKTAIENFMKDMQRLEDDFSIGRKVAQTGADLKFEADDYANKVDQLSKPLLKKISSMYTEEVAQKTMVKAMGAVAQQGHNPMLDFDVVPGQAGTASTTQKINASYTEINDPGFFASLSKGVADYNATMGPVAMASKVISKFWTRGIKSGELARQLTEMLNLRSIVYTDILNAIIGNNIVSTPQGLAKDGSAEIQGSSPDELLQTMEYSSPAGSVKITDLNPTDFESKKAPEVPRSNEGYVHATKLSSYLFENRLVTKRKKVSNIKNKKLANEINEHKKLQDMFKNMF